MQQSVFEFVPTDFLIRWDYEMAAVTCSYRDKVRRVCINVPDTPVSGGANCEGMMG